MWPVALYSVRQKIPPEVFCHFFLKRLRIFSQNFTRLLCVPVHARLQIFYFYLIFQL